MRLRFNGLGATSRASVRDLLFPTYCQNQHGVTEQSDKPAGFKVP